MFGLSYWFLPAFAGCCWLGTLLGLLINWVATGRPQYAWTGAGQTVPYISDIAASKWGYPLFIAGSATTVVVFNISFVAERWLRHNARLAKNYRTSEKILSGFAIAFAIIGGIALILLTVFDTRRHHSIHITCLFIFIAGYIISAVFICAEYQRLGVLYREHRILRSSFWLKLAFIFVELGLAIAFGVLQRGRVGRALNPSAYVEWIISLIYIFYVWSFIIDFLPATQTRHREDRFGLPGPLRAREEEGEMRMQEQEGGNNLGGPVYTGGAWNERGSQGSEVPMYGQAGYRGTAGEVVPPSRNF
ncbi:hypothetical protein B0A48_02541 [Cryoendolithus antarcticus]|uniref:CWH43-like N-terminal domain-containing protein n=1 Tax=Cryoendolithus antarcticus TaxID=1507870 RepID=A0A1V8TNY3_9PEZI|nr:hypothetical protein B0A48_02541 [Cryoendolithus antarcticus]